jgi:hypothetical protein
MSSVGLPGPAGQLSRAAVQISDARAEASRRNGAKSSGPKTPEGKARAARNALKHGLRAAKYVVLPEEDAAEFAALEAALVEELAPVGTLQTVLARRVAVAAWRLARADRLEVEVFEERSYANASPGLALMRDGNGTRSFETLLRYRGAAMAEFWRALKTLKALQAEAQSVEQPAASAPALQASTRGSPLPFAAPAPNEPECPAEGSARPLAQSAHRPTPDRSAPRRNTDEPRPPARPNEPERRAASAPEPRLEYLLPDRPAPGALHESPGARTPNEPESGRAGCTGVSRVAKGRLT